MDSSVEAILYVSDHDANILKTTAFRKAAVIGLVAGVMSYFAMRNIAIQTHHAAQAVVKE